MKPLLPPRSLRPPVVAFGVGCILSLGALVSSLFDDPLALAFGPAYVPMAPSTATIFILLGLASLAQLKGAKGSLGLSWLAVALAAAVGLAAIAGAWLRWGWFSRGWLVHGETAQGGLPLGVMSPATGGMFLLLAAAFATRLVRSGGRRDLPWVEEMGASIGFVVATLVALGYAAGAPLAYHREVVPMALLTAIVFIFYNLGLLLSSPVFSRWRETWHQPEATPSRDLPRKAFQRQVAGLFVVFFVVAGLAGFYFVRLKRAEAKSAMELRLTVGAEMKASQLARWRQERLGEANFLSGTRAVAEDVAAFLARPDDAAARERVLGWLRPIKGGARYSSVWLLDREGRPLVGVPEAAMSRHEEALKAIGKREPTIGELHEHTRGSGAELHIWAPIFPSARPADTASGGAIALVMLTVDPRGALAPLIATMTIVPGETLLVRTSDGEVEPLAGDSATGGRWLRRLVESGACARPSVVHEVLDDNGSEILAVCRLVPDSPWLLVTKAELDRVYATAASEAWHATGLIGALGLAAIFLAASISRHRQVGYLMRALQAEEERKALAARFQLLMEQANDIVILTDEQDRIVEANRRALETYGYTLEELQQLPAGGLRPAESLENFAEQRASWNSSDGTIFETVHRRRDGTTFPVEVSGRALAIGERRYKLGIFRDITQRKAHEAQIERLTRVHSALSHVNQAIVRAQGRESLFAEICRVLVEFGGFSMAWIGGEDAVTRRVVPVMSFGDTTGYLAMVGVYADTRPEGRGPTGTAFREGRAYVCNDFFADPLTMPWREPATRAGFAASLALPVRCGEKVVAVLTVYARTRDFFGEKEIDLLEEAAGDLGFALENLEREARREQAEAELLKAKQDFAKAFIASPTAVSVSTVAEGQFLDVNEAWEQLTGYSRGEAVGRTAIELQLWADPLDREKIRRRVESDQRVRGVELRFRRKGGDGIVVLLSVEVIGFGGVRCFLSTWVDITERQRAEAALRWEQNLFERLAGSIPDRIYFKDQQSRFIRINPAMMRSLGLAQVADAVGKTDVDFFAEEHARQARDDEQAIMRTGQPLVGHEEKETWLDGRVTWVSSTKMPLFDPAGQLLGILGVSRDITARKENERRIREQAELIDKANEAIVVADLENRVTFWSRGAERLSGWSAPEVIGKTVAELCAMMGVGITPEIDRAIGEIGDWRGEIHGRDRSGAPRVIEMSVTVLRDETGRSTGRLSISGDVTEKKKLAEQFLRAQRLESIGMLAAGISHDLNNVLAPIGMAVPLLRGNATDPSDLKLLNALETCAERGAGLVRQILAFVHGIGGEPRLVQVKHLLRDVVNVAAETFPKSIVLEDSVPSDLWPVLANPTQIHQILLNLCVNARDALPHGGTLRLRAENVTLDAAAARGIEGARAGRWLRVRVEDNGTGIPPEVLPRIWEPFFTTKTADKGTGLGLSTVRGIVDSHRGFITLSTAVGKGTIFEVYLPAADSAVVGACHVEAAKLPGGQNELILLADDEPSVRQVATSILVKSGYRVIAASDGSEALALFEKHAGEIALVIADHDMPLLDGDALAEAVGRMNPDMKVLTISGLARTERPAGAQPAGAAHAFLAKPFKVDELLGAVRRLLHESTPADLTAR